MGDRVIAFGGSLLIHAVIAALLFISFEKKPKEIAVAGPEVEVMEAVAVDEARVMAEVNRFKSAEQMQRQQEIERQQRLAEEAQQARQAREQEEQRLADIQKQRAEEQVRRQQEEQKRKAAEEAEQKRLEALKKEQAEVERKRAEEEKRLAELEAKRKQEQEKQRKAEEERRKAEEQRRKAEQERRQAEMAAEAQRRAQEDNAARRKLLASQANQYFMEIANKVRRNWLRPVGTPASFKCEVLVQQGPEGQVLAVRVLQSCGDPALDRSVESAVLKASPLPKPPTPELFDREIKFNYTP